MAFPDDLREHVSEHRTGMLYDLVFAVVWVAAMTVLHGVLSGPQWAYYLLLAAGVPAYFAFQFSLAVTSE